MIIRPVEYSDREKLFYLIEQTEAFNKQELETAIAVVEEALRYPERRDYQIYCACNTPEELAGYICFGPIPMTDACYDLYWIAVDKRFARMGAAARLTAFMEEMVVREGARRIYIETSSTPAYEAARSFYKKNGYSLICMLTDFYRTDDHKLIFMKEVHAAQHDLLPKGSEKHVSNSPNL